MKGIILAGGLGSRLAPLTNVTNKALLPVYNKPMIYYPIELLVNAGIRDILIVCGGNAAGEFLRILGNGEQFGLRHLHYTYQSEPRGIADALGLAEEFVNNDSMCVVLSDNLFENSVKPHVDAYKADPHGAMIFGTRVAHPQYYGVIEQDDAGKITHIVEKPVNPSSNLIATGIYIYDNTVWDFIRSLQPSARGELEITDVNNHYLSENRLKAVELEGWWADAGENIEGYFDACVKARSIYGTKSQAPHNQCCCGKASC